MRVQVSGFEARRSCTLCAHAWEKVANGLRGFCFSGLNPGLAGKNWVSAVPTNRKHRPAKGKGHWDSQV